MKKTLAAIALNLIACSIYAHALWIETNNKGAAGKEQKVKIFYGEYAAQQFEETDKWYSDVYMFDLWLVLPDGTKKQLTYKPGEKCFLASFTPEKEGVYIITTGHNAKELDGTMMYQFNASAVVTVGETSSPAPNALTNNDLYLQAEKQAQENQGMVKVFYKGKPAPKITITVSGPSGWSKSFETDERGELKFELPWKGWYALEAFYTVAHNGTHHDKSYEQIWRCATLRMNLQ